MPPLHAVPPVHFVPQPPQLFPSVEVFTHAPPHDVNPVGHPLVVHAPRKHVEPVAQALPQLPQFVALDERSTHVPLQLV